MGSAVVVNTDRRYCSLGFFLEFHKNAVVAFFSAPLIQGFLIFSHIL